MEGENTSIMLNLTSTMDTSARLPSVNSSMSRTKKHVYERKKQRQISPRKKVDKITILKKNEKGTKFQVISSLFRKNPEKPELPRSTEMVMNEKKDKLFSGDKFRDLELSAQMVNNIENNMKLSIMTSVQKMALPFIFAGKDVLLKSQTGSGKTLAYCIPLVNFIQKIQPRINRKDGPYAIVLVPTRELALQSFDVLKKLSNPFQWIVPGIVTGGEKRKSEKARLRKGINILVATPGRLLDHLEKTKCLILKRLRWLILDEADRLLDMGFEKQIASILSIIKQQVVPSEVIQTILLSATLTEGVERLAGLSLKNYVMIDATAIKDDDDNSCCQQTSKDSSADGSCSTPSSLKQFYVIVPSKLRLVTLGAFLKWKYEDTEPVKCIVFLSSRESVEFHYDLFTAVRLTEGKSMNLFKLHGSMSQTSRTDCYKRYCLVERGILFCTDVAARGLDLPDVNWIIQYNTPGSAADYIHRVGRTARIGLLGNALLFVTPAEIEYLKVLDQLNIRLEELSSDSILRSLVDKKLAENTTTKAKHGAERVAIQEAATKLQTQFEEYILSHADKLRGAKNAYQSFVRAYATHTASMKYIFQVKKLHLGHIAKSFALREAPGQMFKEQNVKGQRRKRKAGLQLVESARKRRAQQEEHSGEMKFKGPLPKKRRMKFQKLGKGNT